MNKRIYKKYIDLLKKHGNPAYFWPQWCAKKKSLREREIIIIGAILTQRTSWHNADLALRNLQKADLFSISKIADLKKLDRFTKLIKPAGFYQTKPKRLYGLCRFIVKECGGVDNFAKEDLQIARQKLLALYGIGPETADTILLYALDKPSFVVDEYTKRLVKTERLSDNFDYNVIKNLFEASLPESAKIYQDFHALIIISQKGEQGSKMNIRR